MDRHSTTMMASAVLALGLAGCANPAKVQERAARQGRDELSQRFRPDGKLPSLPALTAASQPEEFFRHTLLLHPKVEAAYYDWFASVERIVPARTPPDPKLTFQMDVQSLVTSIMPGFMFDIMAVGKFRLAALSATAESRAKQAAFRQAALQAVYDLIKAEADLRLLDQRLAISKKAGQLLGDLEKVAEARNAASQAAIADVLRAQIEQARMQAEIDNFSDSRLAFIAKYKAALGLRATEADPPLPSVPFASFDPAKVLENTQRLDKADNPRLRIMVEDVKRAEAELALAGKSSIPDVSAGSMADVKMKPWIWRPQLALNLPVWRNKVRAEIAAAQADKNAASARLNAEEVALAAELAESRFMVKEALRNRALLNEKLMPKASQAVESLQAAYSDGKSDFSALLDSAMLKFNLEIEAAETGRDLAVNAAGLSLLVAGQLPAAAAQTLPAPALAEKIKPMRAPAPGQ